MSDSEKWTRWDSLESDLQDFEIKELQLREARGLATRIESLEPKPHVTAKQGHQCHCGQENYLSEHGGITVNGPSGWYWHSRADCYEINAPTVRRDNEPPLRGNHCACFEESVPPDGSVYIGGKIHSRTSCYPAKEAPNAKEEYAFPSNLKDNREYVYDSDKDDWVKNPNHDPKKPKIFLLSESTETSKNEKATEETKETKAEKPVEVPCKCRALTLDTAKKEYAKWLPTTKFRHTEWYCYESETPEGTAGNYYEKITNADGSVIFLDNKPAFSSYGSSSYGSSYSSTKYLDPKVRTKVLSELGDAHKFVFDVLWAHPNKTASEIIKLIKEEVKKSSDPRPSFSLRGLYRRFPELERYGLIKRIKRRKCEVTKKFVTEWAVTGDEKTKSKPNPHKAYNILATGKTELEAVESFATAVGWTVLSTEMINPAKNFDFRMLVRTNDGQTFQAGGAKVVGGFVLTRWK